MSILRSVASEWAKVRWDQNLTLGQLTQAGVHVIQAVDKLLNGVIWVHQTSILDPEGETVRFTKAGKTLVFRDPGYEIISLMYTGDNEEDDFVINDPDNEIWEQLIAYHDSSADQT